MFDKVKNFGKTVITTFKGMGTPTLMKLGVGAAIAAVAGIGLHFLCKDDAENPSAPENGVVTEETNSDAEVKDVEVETEE